MKIDTRTKKTIRARIAFSVKLRPHDELTRDSLTSSTSILAPSANCCLIAARTASSLWISVWTRMRRPSTPRNSWILAVTISMSLATSTASTSEILNSSVANSHASPPSKSMPRLRPRNPIEKSEMTTNSSDSPKPQFRRPTKSTVVSPR